METGSFIRELREAKGLSLRRVASRVKVDPAYLSRVERGQVPPSDDLLRHLAEVLERPLEEVQLLAGKVPEKWVAAIRAEPGTAVSAVREALEATEFARPSTPSSTTLSFVGTRAIEDERFPFEVLSEIAEAESWRKEVNRPIYHLHKWWAQRLGSVFRSILIGTFAPRGSDVVDLFFQPTRVPSAVVFDPFMGSGTTIGESLKLGIRAIGRDINPVAYFSVLNGVRAHDEVELHRTYEELRDSLEPLRRDFYSARGRDGKKREALYYFWVKYISCPKCSGRVDLFNSYVFSRHAYAKRNPAAKALCPGCGSVEDVRYDSKTAECSSCGLNWNPQNGPVQRSKAVCPTCSEQFSILETVRSEGRPPAERLYAKIVRGYDGGRDYLPADDLDFETFEAAGRQLKKARFPIPEVEIREGYNTNQALNYQYRHWGQFFNDRQLLVLGSLAARISDIANEDTRDLFLCLFSGLLEFHNSFTSFKGEGTGAVRHMFSHHILKPERTPLEANPLTEDGSGSFPGLFRRRVLAAVRYQQDPFEVKPAFLNGGTGNGKVFGLSQQLGNRVATTYAEFDENKRAVFISCGDSSETEIPTGTVDAVITDPPFFDNVHYSQLADFFFVWQRELHSKRGVWEQESTRSEAEVQHEDAGAFSDRLAGVWRECRRVLTADGVLVFTYHHSRVEGWSSLLSSLAVGNFGIVAAHPIKSEMSVASPKAQAKSPIDIDEIVVCRKRESISVDVPADPEALIGRSLEVGKRQIARFNRIGRKLSENDIRVIMTSQIIRWLSWMDDFEQGLQTLSSLENLLEREISLVFRDQMVSDRSAPNDPELQLTLL